MDNSSTEECKVHNIIRGAFINTAEEKCSIYESGRMVYNCINSSNVYTLDYFPIDKIDVGALASEGVVRLLDGTLDDEPPSYDFWIFNWHFITMASRIDLESIGRLPGIKFSILLEVEPGNPLRHVAIDVFDGYIALDPSTPATGKIFPFPRPLPGEPHRPAERNGIPVISSFGFGTPGKGFPLLVELVNREFDQAVVRVNIPPGTYTSSFDGIHGTAYPQYLAALCRRIAKPGIDVRFSYDFLSPDELLEWCSESDLNCFLYTRRQAGLSATTDQAILSGRPLLTGTNDTFRHIHKYIPPYPVMTLREALDTSAPSVRRLQQDWSSQSFTRTFERMLATFGIAAASGEKGDTPLQQSVRPLPVLVLSFEEAGGTSILFHETRLVDCLGRSGVYDVRLVRRDELDDFAAQDTGYRPAAVVVTGFRGDPGTLDSALPFVTGPKIILCGEAPEGGPVARGEDIFVLPRRPIIPYFTIGAARRPGPPRIWLIGFAADDSNLGEMLERISRDVGEAEVFVEAPGPVGAKLEIRLAALGWYHDPTRAVTVSVRSLPGDATAIIEEMAADSMAVFYHDPSRGEELESLACLALTTERPVVFTHAAPFPQFLGKGTCVEDVSFAEIMAMGVAAHIALYADFGEWQTFAGIDRILSQKIKVWPAMGILDSLPALEGDAFVDGAYRAVLGRIPDPAGYAHHLALLNGGMPKAELVGSLFLSPEGRERQTAIYGPIPGLDGLTALEGGAFVDGAYRAVLGRTSDPAGHAHHLALLNGGMSKAELVGSLFLSPEGQERHLQNRRPAAGTAGELPSLFGGAFVDRAYRAVLGRAPDPDGYAYHVARLKNGHSRAEMIGILFLSEEGLARQAAVHGPMAGLDELPVLEGATFIHRAYWGVLGRMSDPEGFAHHLALLDSGVSKAELVGNLFLSPEGLARQTAPDTRLPGADLLLALRDAHAPAVAEPLPSPPAEAPPSAEPSGEEAPVSEAPAPVEAAPPLPSPPPPSPPAPPIVLKDTESGRSIFVLVEASDSPQVVLPNFVLGLGQELLAQGEILRFVRWSPELKKFVLLRRDELNRLSWAPHDLRHLELHSVRDEPPVLLDAPFTPGRDWLLVPGTVRATPSVSYLFETDLIIEARRLRLGTAFVFHDADPLRRPSCAGEEAAAFELYMQALLLADVLIPASTMAENDLLGFLTQHQRADRVPLIRRIPFAADAPSPAGAAGPDAVRRLRGLLSEASDSARHPTPLYLCLDAGTPSRADVLFAQRLAHAFAVRGIGVVPAAWDCEAGRLVPAAMADLARLELVGGAGVWSEWIGPQETGAPGWVVVPRGVRGAALTGLSVYAKANGLRVAAILTDAGGASEDAGPCFEEIARFDKVLCASDGAFDAFYRFLLSWRGKLFCAEDRFKRLASANEIPERLRPGAPRRSGPGALRIHAVVEPGYAVHLGPLAMAVAEAARQATGGIALTISGVAPDTALAGALKGHAGFELRFDQDRDGAVAGRCREDADVVISLSGDGARAPAVADSLWLGVPCLVLDEGPGTAGHAPGLVLASLRDQAAVRIAILKLLDQDWRSCLAREALALPVRTWNAYARDIAVELATDRLAETLCVPERRMRRDIYAALPNLRRRPRLSICISTYKRAGWVALSLQNIFAQIGSPRSDLEVLVVDNTSPDNTPEVVKPYLDRPDFTYVRNPKNVGMLGNLAVTAQRARGEYIWILGDDDLTRAGTIDRILRILDEHPGIGLIYMNYGYSSENNPGSITDLQGFLDGYNTLEPPGPDEVAPVKHLAAKCENFFTAIYSHVYRRDHGLRSYCQDTSGRIFATMVSCVPTAYYVLHYMADEPAYWIGEPSLVVNSNVSWVDYGAMLELEHLPNCWDLAERAGCDPAEVDRRRANRLWLVEMMWRELFENDRVGNSAYVSPPRLLLRLKHLGELDKYIPNFRAIYDRARREGHPAALLPTEVLFSAFGG
ncbi:DUF4214 domain-containing protein [Azospirillum thermophilum]|nr:DUF4214 domain-containing protein [Azospirillum thermophilum]